MKWVVLTVTEIPKLFTKFHRGTDSMRSNYEGEGIGLFLTKLVVEQHDGKITVESTLNKGTAVTISLPLAHSGIPKQKTP